MREGVNELADGAAYWHPPVLKTAALSGTGVEAVCEQLYAHRALLQRQDRFEELNRLHDFRRMQAYFREVVQKRLQERIEAMALLPRLEAELARGSADPLGAARQLADAVLPPQAMSAETPAPAHLLAPPATKRALSSFFTHKETSS